MQTACQLRLSKARGDETACGLGAIVLLAEERIVEIELGAESSLTFSSDREHMSPE